MGDEANTLDARYRSIGVETVWNDDSGGRSIVERVADWQTNALEVADGVRRNDFDGCWVIMIGTNDAANVDAGSNVGYRERILRMLYVIGDDPVIWLDAASLREHSSYRASVMEAWNQALREVTAGRPNVVVVPWSQLVRREWYRDDGIHFNREGRIWRAAITAGALAQHFPG